MSFLSIFAKDIVNEISQRIVYVIHDTRCIWLNRMMWTKQEEGRKDAFTRNAVSLVVHRRSIDLTFEENLVVHCEH